MCTICKYNFLGRFQLIVRSRFFKLPVIILLISINIQFVDILSMSTDQDSLNSNNNVANDLINTTGTNDVEQEEKNTGLPEDFTITAIKPTDHQHVKGSSKEKSPYSLITTTETIDVQELNTDVNIHTNNIEKESPYEVLPRSSASLNKRIKISQLQRKRLKVDGNTNSMIVIGDSLIGFKDGIPGPFSQIKAVNRKCVKNEPVMNFKLRGDDHTNMPNRPPRKNRNRSSSQQTVKICKYLKLSFNTVDDQLNFLLFQMMFI